MAVDGDTDSDTLLLKVMEQVSNRRCFRHCLPSEKRDTGPLLSNSSIGLLLRPKVVTDNWSKQGIKSGLGGSQNNQFRKF